jgi:hypothetical protein
MAFRVPTFTETPTTSPLILGFGITHQPHGGGDGAKFAATDASPLVRLVGRDRRRNTAPQNPLFVYTASNLAVKTHSGR